MRTKPTYREMMQQNVREYRDAGQQWPASAATIARWMIKHGRWAAHGTAIVKVCAREIAQAMRDEFYTDPQGRRVRVKHAARTSKTLLDGSEEQTMLWDDIRTAPRKFMEVAFRGRRKQIVADCKQLNTDVDSYNENGPVGPEIVMLWDLTDEVVTHQYDPKVIDPDLAAIVSEQPS